MDLLESKDDTAATNNAKDITNHDEEAAEKPNVFVGIVGPSVVVWFGLRAPAARGESRRQRRGVVFEEAAAALVRSY